MKYVFWLLFFLPCNAYEKADLIIIGCIEKRDGLCSLPLSLTEMLKDKLTINYIPSGRVNLTYVPLELKPAIINSNTEGQVSLLTSPVWWSNNNIPADSVPNSFIKIAYSMIESTALPYEWVTNLNNKFDAVAVPDKYYVQVYKNSGVRIPIFVLPHVMFLDDFLSIPLKKTKRKPFRFGLSATLIDRKNYDLIIDAFYKAFKNDDSFLLKLHARSGDPSYIKKIKNKIERLRAKNIKLIIAPLSPRDYVKFLSTLDCYVYLSKGEGFSLTPREAMACGIPCILANNTAQKTICESGFVMAIQSTIRKRAYYEVFNRFIGYNFDCQINDVCQALRNMYENYDSYLKKSEAARQWAMQYHYKNLKKLYIGLLKPKRVILGKQNVIKDKVLITNSRQLFRKYSIMIKRNRK